MKIRSLLLFITMALFLVHCKPMMVDQTLLMSDEHKLFSQIGIDRFEEAQGFSSNQLDLVIVLDAQNTSTELFKQNIFGYGFLDEFQDYDWRVAYTNTSVDKNLVKQDRTRRTLSSCEGGDYVKNLVTGTVGYFGGAHFFAFDSLANILECVADTEDDNEGFNLKTNGSFLPFEYYNKKSVQYLSKEVHPYNDIFEHTMSHRNYQKKQNFLSSLFNPRESYDAPLIQGESSYPLTATLLSISKNLNNSRYSFFRDQSQVVYVVVTSEDAKQKIDISTFQEDLKNAFGRTDRFHLIPVSASADNFCQVQLQKLNTETPTYLNKVSESLGNQSLNLCSREFKKNLVDEIKKHLHSFRLI